MIFASKVRIPSTPAVAIWGTVAPAPPCTPLVSNSSGVPRARGTPELFDTIGVHGGAGATVPQIATAGVEGMRTFDANIICVKREGVSALHAMPLECFQEELAHSGVPIVGVKDVDVLRAKPGPL